MCALYPLSSHINPLFQACKTLQTLVDKVTDPSMKDEEDEIWAGVGFSPNFLKQV